MIIRNLLVLALAAGASMLLSAAPSTASAQVISVPANYISQCSQLVSGDREFAGHGPSTYLTVNLKLASNPTVFYMDVHMDQQETVADWSTGVVDWQNIPLATSPGATHFTHVWKPDAGGTWGWVAIGPGLFWHTGLAYTDTNTSPEVFNNWDWWTTSITIVGDTAGNDITCAANKSGVTINYRQLFLFAQ